MVELRNGLLGLAEAKALIESGQPCCVAGDEALLRRLPRGAWIGGTIPYFMAKQGGACTREQVFVTELPLTGHGPRIAVYDRENIARVCADAPEHGFTVLIVPAFTAVHEAFAQDAPGYADMYSRPLVGWVAGMHLDDLATARAWVVHGPSGEVLDAAGTAIHVPVPADRQVHVDIVNQFTQGDGPTLEFTRGGFSATEALIDGVATNLHDWVLEHDVDTRHPLVADYCGAMINVSIKGLDERARRVDFYAPVFAGMRYRLAARVADYRSSFTEAVGAHGVRGTIVFSCNCILNYAYGAFEGKRTGAFVGPMTFGEIGYQLLNQTLVYLSLIEPRTGSDDGVGRQPHRLALAAEGGH